MKSINYDQALAEYTISEFIKANKRSPNALELRLLKEETAKNLPGLERVGFSGHLITKPQFASVSSAQNENKNREAIYRDMFLADRRVSYLTGLLENTFRGFHATTKSIKRKLNEIESRIDNVLLLTGSTDAFVYGVEENFVIQDKIDFDKSTASVEAGFCTLGRTGFGVVDLSAASISYSTLSDKGYMGFQNTSDVEYLKSDDGTLWEHLVYTNYRSGRVSLLVDVTLDEPQFISEVRFTANTGGTNSKVKATLFYSIEGNNYKAVEPQDKVLVTEENAFDVGIDKVKKIRLLLAKEHYDNTTNISGQFVYSFGIDSIKLYSKSYSSDAESEVFGGPYEIVDEEGNPINFTKATCDVCVSQGETSAVSVFLSNNGVDYTHVDTTSSSGAIVSFDNAAAAGSEEYLEASSNADGVIDTQIIDLQSDEVLLNLAVSSDYSDRLIRKSITVKRNVPTFGEDGSRRTVFDIEGGWFYNEAKKLYKTTVVVNNPLGLSIDLGNTSAFINGIRVSGLVTLKEGASVFETSETNWQVIDAGMTELSSLRKSDPLYPYNHKYLIEGYTYSDTFQGEKIYAGVDEYFGSLLTYVPPELFASPENGSNIDIYTIDNSDGRAIFKVKTDKSNGTWSEERYITNWLINRGADNKVWFRMILNSSIAYNSPVVTSLKIRVV